MANGASHNASSAAVIQCLLNNFMIICTRFCIPGLSSFLTSQPRLSLTSSNQPSPQRMTQPERLRTCAKPPTGGSPAIPKNCKTEKCCCWASETSDRRPVILSVVNLLRDERLKKATKTKVLMAKTMCSPTNYQFTKKRLRTNHVFKLNSLKFRPE